MNPTDQPRDGKAAMSEFKAHLETASTELNRGDGLRGDDFDMDDKPEIAALSGLPRLQQAVRELQSQVVDPWRRADAAAQRHLRIHRLLAGTSIIAGTLAIASAVLQLALRTVNPALATWPMWLELLAAVAALVAVLIGVYAKHDRQWLTERHRAERLRMLKFRALGRADLWSADQSGWRTWLARQAAALNGDVTFEQVGAWAREDRPPSPAIGSIDCDAGESEAFAAYYRHKRLIIQAAYFSRQSASHSRQVPRLHRYSLPIFIASVVCVLIHFALYLIVAGRHEAHALEVLATWTIALAALLPIVAFGVRAWAGAFEHLRSSTLFEAKHRALLGVDRELSGCAADMTQVLGLVAHAENILEEEHREWLRLMLEAEWFL